MATETIARIEFTQDQVELIKRTLCPGVTNDELTLFVQQCKRTGLDPFARQIHAVKRKAKDEDGNWVERLSIQIGIDGFRLIAQRTGEYAGQLGPFWCGADGKWVDVWLSPSPPAAARVGVLRKGCPEPFWAVARYGSYVQMRAVYQDRRKVGEEPNRMWATMPDVMLAKCAEGLALRKAFPAELSGAYTPEEMDQAEGDAQPAPRQVESEPARQLPPAQRPDKAEFVRLCERKGVPWGRVLKLIDGKKGTAYFADKAKYEAVAAEHLASFRGWLERQPDAPTGSPPPASPPPPPAEPPAGSRTDPQAAIENRADFEALCQRKGFSYGHAVSQLNFAHKVGYHAGTVWAEIPLNHRQDLVTYLLGTPDAR